MTGIGKTQLVLQYAKIQSDRNRYAYIFWMSGAALDKLNQGFADILTLVDHPDKSLQDQHSRLVAARLWLEDPKGSNKAKWLLIVDNVDQRIIHILLPSLPTKNARGNILFTTRVRGVAEQLTSYAGTQYRILRLEPLETRAAVKLLLDRSECNSTARVPPPPCKVEELVERIGGLPLAIVQAASFMKESHQTIHGLLKLYEAGQGIEVSI
jgi:hypothetical protein